MLKYFLQREAVYMQYFQQFINTMFKWSNYLINVSRRLFRPFFKTNNAEFSINNVDQSLSNETDRQRIKRDFCKTGQDLYRSLEKYETKHGYW